MSFLSLPTGCLLPLSLYLLPLSLFLLPLSPSPLFPPTLSLPSLYPNLPLFLSPVPLLLSLSLPHPSPPSSLVVQPSLLTEQAEGGFVRLLLCNPPSLCLSPYLPLSLCSCFNSFSLLIKNVPCDFLHERAQSSRPPLLALSLPHSLPPFTLCTQRVPAISGVREEGGREKGQREIWFRRTGRGEGEGERTRE